MIQSLNDFLKKNLKHLKEDLILREKQKNVHAGVVGYVKTFENIDLTNCISLTYDPYKYSSFVIRDSLQPIYCADKVFMKDKKLFMLK